MFADLESVSGSQYRMTDNLVVPDAIIKAKHSRSRRDNLQTLTDVLVLPVCCILYCLYRDMHALNREASCSSDRYADVLAATFPSVIKRQYLNWGVMF